MTKQKYRQLDPALYAKMDKRVQRCSRSVLREGEAFLFWPIHHQMIPFMGTSLGGHDATLIQRLLRRAVW